MFSDFGIRLRRVTPSRGEAVPVSYSHQDDYYIIGLVEKGTGCGIIDFKECRFSEGDIYLIQPGQVHRFVSSEEVEGWMLFADSSFIGSMEKNIFDNFSLFASSVRIDKRRMDELKQIASILADRIDCIADELTKTTVRRLTEAFTGIVAEVVREIGLQQAKQNRRQVEIVLSFRRLLSEHLAENRYPSYYASLLNISPVYLNEAVKKVTGMKVMNKKIPMRKCVGCGEMKNKKEMLRVIHTKEGEFLLDATGRKNGRGAYLCFSRDCFQKAVKNKGLERSFKQAIPNEVYEQLEKEMEQIETE